MKPTKERAVSIASSDRWFACYTDDEEFYVLVWALTSRGRVRGMVAMDGKTIVFADKVPGFLKYKKK